MTNMGRARAIELEENWVWSVQLEANCWADDTFTGTSISDFAGLEYGQTQSTRIYTYPYWICLDK